MCYYCTPPGEKLYTSDFYKRRFARKRRDTRTTTSVLYSNGQQQQVKHLKKKTFRTTWRYNNIDDHSSYEYDDVSIRHSNIEYR